MLTRILHTTPELRQFVEDLHLNLSEPQRRHVCNMADALLVCESDKTLAELQRQFVECVDASNMADTLRIGPWTADDLRRPVGAHIVTEAITQARTSNKLDMICVSLDDSIAKKNKHTRHIEPVGWHYDHVESSPKKPRYANGLAYLECNVWVGGSAVTFDTQIYLRENRVRAINRQRDADERVAFASKNTLARQMLRTLQPLLPTGTPVYVLHDAWYASAKLINFSRRLGWHTVTALKHNRLLNGVCLTQHSLDHRHQRYERVVISATDQSKTTYFTRSYTGRLEDVPFDLRVIDSKWHPRARRSAYFACTDLSLESQPALQIYSHRWGCETDNVYLKSRLGLGDFRVRSYEAVDKFMAVVLLALTYLQHRLIVDAPSAPRNRSLADVIRSHRDEHLCDWLSGACHEAVATGDINAVLQRYLRLNP